jgi:hypothetical protein
MATADARQKRATAGGFGASERSFGDLRPLGWMAQR